MELKDGLKIKGMIPLNEDDTIKYNEKKFAYIVLDLENTSKHYPHLLIGQKLTFTITEIDVETEDELGSYDEEYTTVQDLRLTTKDYMHSLDIPKGQFKDKWESLGAQGQHDGTLAEKV